MAVGETYTFGGLNLGETFEAFLGSTGIFGLAVRILEEGLKASLNIAGGGELAENLSNLYDYCIVQLTKANAFNDDALLVEVRGLIETVAQSWQEISPKGAGASNRS